MEKSDFRNLSSIFKASSSTAIVEIIQPNTIMKTKYNITNPIIKKSFKKMGGIGYFGNYKNIFENETKYLTILNGYKNFPIVYYIDTELYIIYMEYCGENPFDVNLKTTPWTINYKNIIPIPIDWKEQLKTIINVCKNNNINHNDMFPGNLLINDGIIKLIDFGWTNNKENYPFYNITELYIDKYDNLLSLLINLINDVSEQRIYYDKYLQYRISSYKEELYLCNGFRQNEIHTMIIWDIKDKDKTDMYLKSIKNTIKIVSKEIVKLDSKLQTKLALSLYFNEKDNRVKDNNLYLIILNDTNPIYQYSKATACNQVLNINMQEIKEVLRIILGGSKKAYYKVHTSYNIEEANLCLSVFNQSINRIKFNDFKEFFDVLNNNNKLKYLVQRSYNDISDINNFKDGSDIDILVNDYYMFKSLVGARSNNKKYMRENDNGFYIQNNVIIGNNRVNIDVRYVGDNYYSDVWEFEMLENRKMIKIENINVYIPSEVDELYSLLYLVLVQKHNKDTSKHHNKIKELLYSVETIEINKIGTINEFLKDINGGWTFLYNFLVKRDYNNIKKSKDIMVGFYTEPLTELMN
jgi:hypothetical protein